MTSEPAAAAGLLAVFATRIEPWPRSRLAKRSAVVIQMAMSPEEALAKRQQLCEDGFVSARRPATHL